MTQTGDAHPETTSPTDTADDHPFALDRCTTCGYDLSHLPVPRDCPECGEPADADTLLVRGITIDGWLVIRRVALATALYIAAVPMVLLVDSTMPLNSVARTMIAVLCPLAIVLISGAWLWHVRRGRPLGWMRLDRAGIRFGFGRRRAAVVPWAYLSRSSMLSTPPIFALRAHTAAARWTLHVGGRDAHVPGAPRRIAVMSRPQVPSDFAALHRFRFRAAPPHARWLHERVRAMHAAHVADLASTEGTT